MIKQLLTFEEATRIIEANFKTKSLGDEEIVLLEVYNRVTSEEILTSFDHPSFNVSTVHGYAVKATDTLDANESKSVVLKVTGCVNAGESPNIVLSKGEAIEVTPEAILPEGADSVISIHDVEREDDILQVFGAINTYQNIQKRGSDLKTGTVVIKKGQVLGPSEIAVLAALGLKQVKVQKAPIVAVLSVGNKICELGKISSTGKSYDMTSYGLCTAVMENSGKPIYFGAIADDKDLFSEVLKTAVNSADMVVICVDDEEYVKIVDSLGNIGLIINGLALKPGKSTAVAVVDDKFVFCLPNNPSVALLMYHLFVRSVVQRLGGRPISGLKTLRAFAGSKMFSSKGSRTYITVKLEFDRDCRLIADPVKNIGNVSALAMADGFVEIKENEHLIDVNQEVSVLLFRGLAGKER